MTGPSLDRASRTEPPPGPVPRPAVPSISATIVMYEADHQPRWTTPDSGVGIDIDRTGSADLEVMVSPPKVAKLGNYSLWCYFITIMPAVVPVLILIKDSDITRRIFLGFFIAVLVVILVCFSLVIFQTRTRQMFRAASASSRRSSLAGGGGDQYAEHGLRRSVPPVDSNLLAATHRIQHRLRSAYRVARQTEVDEEDDDQTPPRLLQSPIHSSRQLVMGSSPARASSSPAIHVVTSGRSDDFVRYFGYHVQLTVADETSATGALLAAAGATSAGRLSVEPRDSPPPYHVAVNLPTPDPHWVSVTVSDAVSSAGRCETPPPSYEQTLN